MKAFFYKIFLNEKMNDILVTMNFVSFGQNPSDRFRGSFGFFNF